MLLKGYLALILCTFLFDPIPLQPVSQQNAQKPILVLYYAPYCPYSQKVLNYLTQVHKTVDMKNAQADPQAREELKRRGGKSQVPCLFIDGYPLYESDAIIYWLSQHLDDLEQI